MITDKKQLLLITSRSELQRGIKEGLSMHFEVHTASSLHTGFNCALNLLPDIILIDYASYRSGRNFKNISNFKSTHFLNKAWLIVYADESLKMEVESRFRKVVDEFIYSPSVQALCGKIIKLVFANNSLSNFWKDSFMGLFNLMAKPVVLLQQDEIVAMNDSFKQHFRIEKIQGLKLTDLVQCENKAKVKNALRNFGRGKHMKASTKTALLLRSNKIRDAKISFSKLNKNYGNHFIMIIDFNGDEVIVNPKLGTSSELVEACFKENSNIPEFSFTKREKEIIQLLIKGYKTKDISSTLFISPKTIEKHRSNIIKRTNSETILESIIYAINHNLIDSQKA